MSNESKLSFDDLLVCRHQLQRFCSTHYNSLIAFRDGVSFKVDLGESKLGPTAKHLSSSATCIESLLDCPEEFLPKRHDDLPGLARTFALSALSNPHKKWLSDGSAHIYCRCRTLPLVVCHLPRYQNVVQEHLERILFQLKKDPLRLAIGEAAEEDSNQDNWYPPNAFHTYWTLELLHAVETKFPEILQLLRHKYLQTRFNLDRLRAEMLLWAQHTAGYQTALHASDSSMLDSDQLAWSLATIVKFHGDFQANLAQQDFIRYGLKCLFAHQTPIGIWRTGSPLFHYLKSGNAYCYIFETFAVLLKSALTNRKEGVFLRQVLRPYLQNLLALWHYATSTQIPLPEGSQVLAWASGHRANRKDPESWATASVYSFSECLRRLIGIWTRESAAEELKVITTRVPHKEAIYNLADRGNTWAIPEKTTANQLMTLFINPVRFFESGDKLEPDSQPIKENQARAAILFGPPGTSKTTLARCVAEAIGWDFVELHASNFVADGLPNVQRTANCIFEKLLQLDRTVILFDEIDELVRTREKDADAFGRFLTTSMLPKLAELWKDRKVIYFVATNHISFFDSAVTRAERFDASVRVSPPSLEKKLRQVKKLLRERGAKVALGRILSAHVEKALQGAVDNCNKNCNNGAQCKADDDPPLPESFVLAKLLLMRWDQLQELASIIRRGRDAADVLTLNRKVLEAALAELADPFLQKCRLFKEYLESDKYEQHDFSKVSIWEIKGRIAKRYRAKLTSKSDVYWHISTSAFGDFSDLPFKCALVAPGVIECRK